MAIDLSPEKVLLFLRFAGLSALLFVLIERHRVRRFPWFTASIGLSLLRLLMSRPMFWHLWPRGIGTILIVFADVMALLGLMVVREMARRAFDKVHRRTWLWWALGLLAGGIAVAAAWGPWPTPEMLKLDTERAVLRLLGMAAVDLDLMVDLVTVELGLLVALIGRRMKGRGRSHTLQIVIGLSVAAASRLIFEGGWHAITLAVTPVSAAERAYYLGLRDMLFNINSGVFAAALAWWIVCLWTDDSTGRRRHKRRRGRRAATASTGRPVLAGEGPVNEGKKNPLRLDGRVDCFLSRALPASESCWEEVRLEWACAELDTRAG